MLTINQHEKRKTPILEFYDFVLRNIFCIFVSINIWLVFLVTGKSLLSSAVEHFAVNEGVLGSKPRGDAKRIGSSVG